MLHNGHLCYPDQPICGLLIIGMIPLIGQLNRSIAGLGSPSPSGVDLICSKAICGSDLISRYLFSVHFISLIHASTCPLLWWWYDENNACSMFRLLQNVLSLCEKSDPLNLTLSSLVAQILKKKFYMLILECLLINLPPFWWQRTCCNSLQYKGNFYGFAGGLWWIMFSFCWVCWKLRHVEHFLCTFQYHH